MLLNPKSIECLQFLALKGAAVLEGWYGQKRSFKSQIDGAPYDKYVIIKKANEGYEKLSDIVDIKSASRHYITKADMTEVLKEGIVNSERLQHAVKNGDIISRSVKGQVPTYELSEKVPIFVEDTLRVLDLDGVDETTIEVLEAGEDPVF